jgi:hypothetical protein
MVVHIDSTMPQAYPLTLVQSRDLLGFCRSVGAAVFTVNFLYVKGEESEERAHAFYRRFRIFSDGERLLESVCGNGFELRESWVLNDESIKAILMGRGGTCSPITYCTCQKTGCSTLEMRSFCKLSRTSRKPQ